jgi:HWE histidine kinase
MVKLIDEFRRGWQGTSEPSPLFSIGFAASCLALATAARWCLSLIRPDVFFIPYIPAVFFATAFGGYRIGIATAVIGGTLGVTVNFSDASADFARLALLVIYLTVCGLTIWGVEHYRSVAAQQRQISKRLMQEEQYRKLVVDEFQHRLKNKLSTIHAVIHLVLQDQPQIWAGIDQRLRALSATDDLIARVDGTGCDIKDLLISELGPYGHIYPEWKSAVSPRQIGGEPGIDISRTRHQCREIRCILFHARAVAGVMVGVGRPPQHYLGRDRGSPGRNDRGGRLWHQALEVGAAAIRRQDRDRVFEDRGSLHNAMPHPAGVSALQAPDKLYALNNAALTRGERSLYQ